MHAIIYRTNPAGWLTCKCLRRFWPGCLHSRLNGLHLVEMDPPSLPAPDWVRLRTLLCGICGSDLAILDQKQPADSILQAFTSMPMVLGHEVVGLVEEVGPAVDKCWLGRRVCVEPTLCCEVRGIDPPCRNCADGRFGACENLAADGLGSAGLPAGTGIGYNSRTGGGLGERFVAHASRLFEVPADLSDESAVLTDPLACSLHAVLRADLTRESRILVYGSGMMGLAVVALLRAVGFSGTIHAIVRHDFQADLAGRLGADGCIRLPADSARRFQEVASRVGGSVQVARFGRRMLSGGYDVVFECTGASVALEEACKWTRSGGQVVLVGTGSGRGADLTSVWFTELTLIGAYGRSMENFEGRRISTYQLVHELLASGRLRVDGLLTHTFRIKQYRSAFEAGMEKGRHRAVKVAIDFR